MTETKPLAAYYSLDGNTRFIAETLAMEVDAHLLEINPVKPYPNGFTKYIWGSFSALRGEDREIKGLDKNPADYDFLFLGTPVWAGRMVPPVKMFLKENTFKDKEVAVYCCCGGSAGQSLKDMKQMLSDARVMGEKVFRMPLKDESEAEREVRDWMKKLF